MDENNQLIYPLIYCFNFKGGHLKLSGKLFSFQTLLGLSSSENSSKRYEIKYGIFNLKKHKMSPIFLLLISFQLKLQSSFYQLHKMQFQVQIIRLQ